MKKKIKSMTENETNETNETKNLPAACNMKTFTNDVCC